MRARRIRALIKTLPREWVMSRGPGRLQRWLWLMIKRHGKPMTFEDIRAVIRKEFEVEDGIKLYSSFERSLRRALHLMVSDGGVDRYW